MDNINPTEVPVEEPKVHTAAEMENARAAHRQSLQTLDITYRNVVGVFADRVDMGDMERETAIQMLTEAGIPEHYFEHLSMVDVEVEVEYRATFTFTDTVVVKVRLDGNGDVEEDAIIEALEDDGLDVTEVLYDNATNASITDDDWEIESWSRVD